MEKPTRAKIDGHYPKDAKWVHRLGEKTLATYEKYGYDAKKELGTTDPDKIGKMVRSWLLDFMCSGPVVKMVIKGVHAVDMVRKLAGSTMPSAAEMGTIRGDYSVDSQLRLTEISVRCIILCMLRKLQKKLDTKLDTGLEKMSFAIISERMKI